MTKKISEAMVQRYFKKRVKELGGLCRKVKWEGRNSAPDWYVSFPAKQPYSYPGKGRLVAFVELKAPGEYPRPDQVREHDRLRSAGTRVFWFNSYEGLDIWLATAL